VTLLELPDVPLIRVLYFIDLEDLLVVVNRVCKRLNDIIKYSTVLWTVLNTEFDKEIASSLQQSHGQIQYVKYERIIQYL
jgi:hypothetical protein